MQRSLALLAAAVLGTSACADSNDDLGQLDLSLVGQAPSGTLYRLRDAELTIDGPGGARTFRTEDDPSRTQIDTRLPSGAYTLRLSDGWRLERVTASGGETVAAAMASEIPLPFQMQAGEVTAVVLRFRAGADDVDLGEGDLSISIGVDEVEAPTGPQEIVATPNVLGIGEGGTAAVGVHLAQPISAPLTVAVSATGAISVSPATLTFTPANRGIDQVLLVTAPQDANAVSDVGQLILAAAGAVTRTIDVTVSDDDELFVMVEPTQLAVVEGQAVPLRVRLSAQPSSHVSIAIGRDRDLVSVSPPTLLFTANDWDVVQTVSVSARQDADLTDDVTSLELQTTTEGRSASVPVQIDDDDFQRIVIDPPAIELDEGTTRTATVRLAFPVTTSISLPVSASGRGVTAEPSMLFFTPDSWSAPQTLTIRGVSPGTASVSVSSGELDTIASIAVTVRDVLVSSLVGWPQGDAASTVVSPDFLQLFPIELTERSTLQSLQVLAAAAGGRARFAVYSDANDRPANLVVATVATPIVAAPQPTHLSTPAIELPRGRYWIGVVVSERATLVRSNAMVTRCTVLMDFTGSFPVTPTTGCAGPQVPLAIAATVQR